jgi:hypothetical protein
MHPFTPSLRCLAILCSLVCVATHADPKDVGDPTQPTLITLKLANASPKTAFEELGNKSGQTFLTLPANMWDKNPGNSINVDIDNQPFWLAIKDICGKTGISLKYATDTAMPKIILSRDNQDWTTYPTTATGPFLVSLIGLHRATTVDMRKPTEVQKTFYAKFTVFCEPRIRLLRGSLGAKIDTAVDDKGNSLLPKEMPEQPLNFITSWVYNLEGKLDYPKEPGTKIAQLKASAKFIAQMKSETIEYADPLTSKNVTKTVAGRKIIIKEVRRTPDEYEATVTFVRGEIPQAQWEQTVFPGNTLRLVDGDNKFILAKGFGMGGKGDESTFVFKFEKEPPRGSRIGKPLKLAWEIPTETREVPLTFEFKDLPLP